MNTEMHKLSRRVFLHRALSGAFILPAGLPLMAARAAQIIRIAVTPGPHEEVMRVVSQVASARGLALDVQVFPKVASANAALARGSIDAASMQNGPAFDADAGTTALVTAARTLTLPMGVYSKHISALSQLKRGDRVAIPGDAAGRARALILLHNLGVLVLRENAGYGAGLPDISTNRLQLKLATLPPAQLAARLGQFTLAVIGYQEAAQAGWRPGTDSIAVEDAFSPYADVLAIRKRDREQPWVASLIDAYHSEPVKRFILQHYQESVRRPW